MDGSVALPPSEIIRSYALESENAAALEQLTGSAEKKKEEARTGICKGISPSEKILYINKGIVLTDLAVYADRDNGRLPYGDIVEVSERRRDDKSCLELNGAVFFEALTDLGDVAFLRSVIAELSLGSRESRLLRWWTQLKQLLLEAPVACPACAQLVNLDQGCKRCRHRTFLPRGDEPDVRRRISRKHLRGARRGGCIAALALVLTPLASQGISLSMVLVFTGPPILAGALVAIRGLLLGLAHPRIGPESRVIALLAEAEALAEAGPEQAKLSCRVLALAIAIMPEKLWSDWRDEIAGLLKKLDLHAEVVLPRKLLFVTRLRSFLREQSAHATAVAASGGGLDQLGSKPVIEEIVMSAQDSPEFEELLTQMFQLSPPRRLHFLKLAQSLREGTPGIAGLAEGIAWGVTPGLTSPCQVPNAFPELTVAPGLGRSDGGTPQVS